MNKLIMLLFCLLLPAPAFSAAASLESVVALALEHAPLLQAAEAARDASTEDITLGRASLLPYVVANASLTRRDKDFSYDRANGYLLTTAVRNNEQMYGVTAYQPLFDVEKWALYQQGKILAATGELKLSLQRQQTILEASAAWLNVIRAQAAFAAAQASEQAMDKLALQARAAFEVGTAAVNDSLSASSRRDLTKAARIRAGQVLSQAEAQLNSLVGKPVMVAVVLHQGMQPLHAKPDDLETWEQRAEVTALGVQLSDQAVAMADAEHLKSLGAGMPAVQLVAGWDQNKSSDGMFGGLKMQAASIGIEITMPLYAGGATWSQQRKATHEKVQAEFNMAEARRTARLAAHQSLLGLRTTAAEVQALDAALGSAETEKNAAQASFDVGLRTITQALDAEERLAVARQNYADAVVRHAMAYLQLIASANALDASSVALIDHFLSTR